METASGLNNFEGGRRGSQLSSSAATETLAVGGAFTFQGEPGTFPGEPGTFQEGQRCFRETGNIPGVRDVSGVPRTFHEGQKRFRESRGRFQETGNVSGGPGTFPGDRERFRRAWDVSGRPGTSQEGQGRFGGLGAFQGGRKRTLGCKQTAGYVKSCTGNAFATQTAHKAKPLALSVVPAPAEGSVTQASAIRADKVLNS